MNQIAIRGDGVAAYCCAYLLDKAGLSVALQPVDRPRLPAILLGDHALALIRDIFDRRDLFRRCAARSESEWWRGAPDSNVLAVDHSAVVVSEELLLKELSPTWRSRIATNRPDWTIFASRPLPAPVEEHRIRFAHGVRRTGAPEGRLRPPPPAGSSRWKTAGYS